MRHQLRSSVVRQRMPATLGLVAIAGDGLSRRPPAPWGPTLSSAGAGRVRRIQGASRRRRGGHRRSRTRAVPRGKWWEVYGDTALNQLEEQVSLSNQNVLAALARYREARDQVRIARSGPVPNRDRHAARSLVKS